MRRSRKINPSLPITLLTKSLTLTSDMMARKSLVIEVYKHSFHKVSLLTLESAIRSLKKFKMYQLQKLELFCIHTRRVWNRRTIQKSHDDYARHKNGLPDVKSINDYKHKKVLHKNIPAANVLINKHESSKITLYYDTTARS